MFSWQHDESAYIRLGKTLIFVLCWETQDQLERDHKRMSSLRASVDNAKQFSEVTDTLSQSRVSIILYLVNT